MRRQSESGREVFNDEKVVLVMVGLPARGKSFISHKIKNFLSWLGVRANIFNVGSLRRKMSTGKQSYDFFDAQNVAAKQQREELAYAALDMALEWLGGGGEVAIFDATNTTNDRRVEVISRCHRFSSDIKVIFLESICNNAQKVTNSPDYKDMELEDAMADLRKRIEKYESVYEPLDNDELSYVKLINMQSKVICNHIYGNMAHMLVPFLMSVHIMFYTAIFLAADSRKLSKAIFRYTLW
uniref:6-phosphofructo-2-kinase domain-containing protein n=1 Tax=Globisporangium ultimum (strain ATCC 200006 / CBS 805.95 / DAOM BR144) TaxID=431595 RepID=K3WPK5_GLOUD